MKKLLAISIAVSLAVGTDGTPGPVKWLTNTAGSQEHGVHLARYGEDLLVAWNDGDRFLASLVNLNGVILTGPEEIPVQFADGDDFTSFSNGDVGWAYAWGDMGEIKVVRSNVCP